MSTMRLKCGLPWISHIGILVSMSACCLLSSQPSLLGILKAGSGDLRALWLLIGPGLAVWLAEVGYSTVKVFYHRFIDAYLTLFNVQRMLRLDDSGWMDPGIAQPFVPSKYGGFAAQWV